MDDIIRIINEYIDYKEKLLYKKELGYTLSFSEINKLRELKLAALEAKQLIKEENKRIKKLVKSIK